MRLLEHCHRESDPPCDTARCLECGSVTETALCRALLCACERFLCHGSGKKPTVGWAMVHLPTRQDYDRYLETCKAEDVAPKDMQAWSWRKRLLGVVSTILRAKLSTHTL